MMYHDKMQSRPGFTLVASLHDRIVGLEACEEGGVFATLIDGSVVKVRLDDSSPTLVSAPGGIN
jgi:hypothetical protein